MRALGYACALPVLGLVGGLVTGVPTAAADNKRFNDGVVANVYTVQRQAGCDTDIKINPKLRLAAEWHTNDVLNNRALGGDIGSDGSTVADRARNAGYAGAVTETVAINPALAMSGIELINQWYHRPDYKAIMADCSNVDIGVWSANALDRTVVVAVYGKGDGAPPAHGPGRPFGEPGSGAQS
ncbi:CAP domain-containing protein [Mycolicibacterium novocastrense]|nr:CAP domain-containing protein [Mycolicibacterium novocastrense]